MKPINRLIYLGLNTPNFDEMVDFYARHFGLAVQFQQGGCVNLAGADGTPVLRLNASTEQTLAELAFAVASRDLLEFQAELAGKGYSVVARTDGSFSIRDPSGRLITFVAEDDHKAASSTPDGKPLFLSHVVINSPHFLDLISFFVDVLGFSISDRYEKHLLTFLRCAQPQHHCIGVSPGELDGLNHFSVDCGSIDGVMKSVGRMKKAGIEPIWGPGRHGPGGNIFCYYEDPAGFVPEFTCDVLQIADDESWDVTEWPRIPETANVWGTGGPSPRAIELMSGKASEH